MWCCIASIFVLGPYFFEQVTSKGMKTCFIISVRYTTILQNYQIRELHQRNVVIVIAWMQDGVPSHVATRVRQVLEQHFGDTVISWNFEVTWQPWSLILLEWISGFGVSEIKEIHLKCKWLIRTERCHKTGSYIDCSYHLTFVIIVNYLPHVMRYRLQK